MAQTKRRTAARRVRPAGRSATRRSTARRSTARPDAIALLKADHRKVEELFSQLEKTTERGADRRTRLLGQIEGEIKLHMRLEEEVFYPAFRDAVKKKDDKELYHEAHEEHHVADMVLGELKALSPTDETFGAKAKLLKELIEHHVEEEEGKMFPKARRAMGTEGLRQLGEEMASRKEAAQGGR